MDEVKLRKAREPCGEVKNERVYDNQTEAERENNEGAEDEGEDGFEEKVEDCEDEAEEDEARYRRRQHEAGDPAVREPECECVSGYDECKFQEPMHRISITEFATLNLKIKKPLRRCGGRAEREIGNFLDYRHGSTEENSASRLIA